MTASYKEQLKKPIKDVKLINIIIFTKIILIENIYKPLAINKLSVYKLN